MLDEEKVVTTDSTPVIQDVNQEAEVVQTPTEAELSGETSSPQKTIADQAEEIDEKGVPYKNRYEEMRRKNEQLAESIPQMIEQSLKQNLSNLNQQKSQPQEYSIEQIEAFVTENPQYKGWGENEKAKLTAKLAVDEMEKRMGARDRQREEGARREQSFKQLTSEFSELFVKDSQGRPVWDNNNPIVREVAGIMQDPDLQKRPDGLYVAAEIAYSRAARRGQINTVKKETKLKAQVKSLEKKTFTEGGNKSQVAVKNDVKDAIADLKKSGSKKDVSRAVGAYFRQSGYIQ